MLFIDLPVNPLLHAPHVYSPSSTVPPDDFIANCKFPLSDLIGKAEQPLHEIWVDLEPNGKLHVKIELLWATQDEQNQPNRAFQVGS